MSETTVILKHEAARTETRGQGDRGLFSSSSSSVCPDAEILPGSEEHVTFHVTRRPELAGSAVSLPGRSPQRAAENLPPVEGQSGTETSELI